METKQTYNCVTSLVSLEKAASPENSGLDARNGLNQRRYVSNVVFGSKKGVVVHMNEANPFLPDTWAEQLQNIDLEIARQASICQISLLEPGMIERVLACDLTVCNAAHENALHTLRALLYMHYTEITNMSHTMGIKEAQEIASKVSAHLLAYFGTKSLPSDMR